MSDFDREAMMETYLYEMNQMLEQLENNIILAESGYSIEMINEIFRIMHTIKGSSAMMFFNNISTATHAVEDLFFYLRENQNDAVDFSKVTDLVLETEDFVKGELNKLENGMEANGDPDQVILKLKMFLEELKNGGKLPGPTVSSISLDDLDEYEAPGPATVPEEEKNVKPTAPIQMEVQRDTQKSGGYNYYAKLHFEAGSEMENVRAYTVLHNLGDSIYDISHVPDDIIAEEATYYIRNNGFEITFSSQLGYDEIYDIFMKSLYIKDLELISLDEGGMIAKNEYRATLTFEDGCEMENVRAFAVVHNLEKQVEGMLFEPDNLTDENSALIIKEKGFRIDFITSKSYEEIYKILSSTIYLKDLKLVKMQDAVMEKPAAEAVVDTGQSFEDALREVSVYEDEKTDVMEAGAAAEKAQQVEAQAKALAQAQADQQQPQQKRQVVQHAISVSVQKLDQLLNLVGELVISEAMVTQNPELEGLELDSFTKEARQLHKTINDIQDTVMSMRMVPLSPTFFKMHRIVRDMCKHLGKEAQLEVLGEDTEVDKNIIEHISDPLMHIIRNSIDHGIEAPEKRVAAGKPEKGTVVLEAKNSGGDVLISIRDDGAGFNREKILEKARKHGMLSKPEDEYTDKEVYQFVLLPGFSTNDQVTEYSGRGVGMDVVVNNIEMVGGSVIVDSTPGEGSAFVLKIPLTLAIIEGMIIKVGEAKFTIPIISIKNFLKAENKDLLFDPNGNEMIMVREDCYNFVRLNRLFGMDVGYEDVEEGIVMMLENGDQTVCVLVDDLLGEQQVVVKSIPRYIKKVRGIGGCTLLGDGDISLIIDVAGFFDR